MDNTNPQNLEQAFEMLEDIIDKLEDPALTLEESFDNYSKGVQLLKYANSTIDRVEKQVQVLNANGELEDFGDLER